MAYKALELLRSAHEQGRLRIAPNEVIWFDTLKDSLDDLPDSESEFIGQQLALADRSRFLPEEYGLQG